MAVAQVELAEAVVDLTRNTGPIKSDTNVISLDTPAYACKKKDTNNDKSLGLAKSKSSKSSQSSAKHALENDCKMQKKWKKQKKSFATLEAQLEEDANQSGPTDSEE
jgi:hypothetical protein